MNLNEREFWQRLEYAVTSVLSRYGEGRYEMLWCDGFDPRGSRSEGSQTVIFGDAWVGVDGQDVWQFELRLPRPTSYDADTPWAGLLPEETESDWLDVDVQDQRLVIDRSDAAYRSVGDVRFRLALGSAGWATLTIESNGKRIDVPVSYLNDGIGEFATAVLKAVQGNATATARLQDEPGEHRFELCRKDEVVRLTVQKCLETFSVRDDCPTLFTTTCSRRSLATACIGALRRVRDRHGTSTYGERWRHPFPQATFDLICSARRALS